MIKYRIEKNKKSIYVNGKDIVFNFLIRQVIEFNNILIVRIQTDDHKKPSPSRNIFAYDKDGNHLWSIEKVPPVEHFSTPYTNVFIADEDYMKRHYDDKTTERKLIAYNMHGYDYEVDIETGKIKLVEGQTRAW